jgi:hypothetical protein
MQLLLPSGRCSGFDKMHAVFAINGHQNPPRRSALQTDLGKRSATAANQFQTSQISRSFGFSQMPPVKSGLSAVNVAS